MNNADDITRLRDEYRDRKYRLSGSDVYSMFNQANLFIVQQRQRTLLRFLKKYGKADLAGLKILEVGCGSGGVLLELLSMGAYPENLYGVDLLEERLELAKKYLPVSKLAHANGQHLPYTKNSFDVVLQFTAVSSILDEGIRLGVLREMARVLRQDGLILSYDFFLNPTNKQTKGLGMKEIRSVFPDYQIEYCRITLAPPLARRLVPLSWGLGLLLESLKIFNTHYLAAIRPAP
ncbi:MAG: methyltransferase domain-containing protein [Anaerolineales bacterium]|nr:methyltransferase domain-containing protein [Anaerolineales bacterium]